MIKNYLLLWYKFFSSPILLNCEVDDRKVSTYSSNTVWHNWDSNWKISRKSLSFQFKNDTIRNYISISTMMHATKWTCIKKKLLICSHANESCTRKKLRKIQYHNFLSFVLPLSVWYILYDKISKIRIQPYIE